MIRRILLFVIFSCLPILAHADYIVRDISVRDGLGGAYDQSVSLASSGKAFDMKISLISDNSSSPLLAVPHRVSLTLPGGLQYVSYTVESSDCAGGNGFFNAKSSNSSFSFDFTPNTSICESIVRIRYQTNGIGFGVYSPINPTIYDAGIDGIFGTADDTSAIITLANSIALNITTKNPLLSAKTVDTNGNGYIDAYDLTFGNTIGASFPATTTSLSYLSSSVPGVSFSYSAGSSSGRLLFTDSLLDTAAVPGISIPSDVAYESGNYFVGVCQDGAAPVVNTSIPVWSYTGALSVSLSASESGTIRYSTGTSVTITSPLYSGTPISVNGDTTLLTLATDAFGNSATKNFVYTFSCSNSAPAHGSLTAYPACAISCNSGYHLSGSSCVANSSGGGGGGWGGGGGGSITPITPTASGSTSTGSTSTGTTNTGTIVSSGGTVVSGGYGEAPWLTGGGGASENRYVYAVTKVAKDNLVVYRTKSLALSSTLAKWEKKYLFKINAVYLSKSINAARYKETILAWNRFILYASMWKMDRPLESYKSEAIKAYEIFYKVYRRPVLPTSSSSSSTTIHPTTTVSPSTSSLGTSISAKQAKILVSQGTSLVFTKNLSIGSKSTDVLRLQKILIAFGYLKTSAPTDYFGQLTSSALKLFQKEVLEMSSTSGTLDTTTRTKMRELSGE